MSKPLYRSVDEIGLRYLELGESIGSVQAIDYAEITGECCARCGGGPKTRMSRPQVVFPLRHRESHWRYVCADCREPWEARARKAVPRGKIRVQRRRGSVEHRLLRHADEWSIVRRLVEPRPHTLNVGMRVLTLPQRSWDFSVLSWLTYLRGDVGSVMNVVKIGRVQRPQFEGCWEGPRVRRAISVAQRVVAARAVQRRVLRPQDKPAPRLRKEGRGGWRG